MPVGPVAGWGPPADGEIGCAAAAADPAEVGAASGLEADRGISSFVISAAPARSADSGIGVK
ncbi:hypothetical protein C5E46_34700 [Nocardia nova]|nr:hypothetical protein C5E46_34700 [Nocardia nova]